MSRRDDLLRNCSILNLVLLMAVMVAAVRTIPPLLLIEEQSLPALSGVPRPAVEPQIRSDADSHLRLGDFRVITEQSLFHPSRRIITGHKQEPPLSTPDIVLYGTLRMDDFTAAFVEDRKSPYSTLRRGKRQRILKKGEIISGFVLTEIWADKILLVRADEKLILSLSDKKNRKAGGEN